MGGSIDIIVPLGPEEKKFFYFWSDQEVCEITPQKERVTPRSKKKLYLELYMQPDRRVGAYRLEIQYKFPL